MCCVHSPRAGEGAHLFIGHRTSRPVHQVEKGGGLAGEEEPR